jgi:hypothetical protein
MSCTSMEFFQNQVESMSPSQKQNAATVGFSKINSMPDSQKNVIVLGLCAVADLYSIDISTMPGINNITDLEKYKEEAANIHHSEKFDFGLKSFFTINYSPSTDRDEMFLGMYASASIAHMDMSLIKEQPVTDVSVGPVVGPVKSIW